MESAGKTGRVLRLATMLKSGARFDVPELATRLSVSPRTIYRDLTTLRQSGIWGRFDEASGGFFVADEGRAEPVSAASPPQPVDDVRETTAAVSHSKWTSPGLAEEIAQRDEIRARLDRIAAELRAIKRELAIARDRIEQVTSRTKRVAERREEKGFRRTERSHAAR